MRGRFANPNAQTATIIATTIAMPIGTALASPASPTTGAVAAARMNCRNPRNAEAVPACSAACPTASVVALPKMKPIDACSTPKAMRVGRVGTPESARRRRTTAATTATVRPMPIMRRRSTLPANAAAAALVAVMATAFRANSSEYVPASKPRIVWMTNGEAEM